MTKKLAVEAVTKVTLGILLLTALLFLPAGTLNWPNAQLLMGLLFVPMVLAGFVMMAKSPDLLRKRLKAREERAEQDVVIKLSALMFVAGFVLAGLDFRFGWTQLPGWAVKLAAGVFLLTYALYAEVLRENAYLSRVIEVQEGQKVVDTGLYGVVRHPMYAVTVLLFLSMPLVLGSAIAFVCFLPYPFILVRRIRDEEALLEAELQGYAAYKQKVKYRLVPLIW